MKITDIVVNRINRFKSGYIFTYNDFDVPVDKTEALKKTLSRLVASGKIIRLSKGQFYKPEVSQFGSLQPSEYQVVKDLLEADNKVIGYLTGVSAFNKLGLTTQISNTIQIGTNIDRKPRKRGKYNIRFIRQKNTISKDNIYLLQILDSIRFIKIIPDSNVNNSVIRIKDIIQKLSNEEQKLFVKLALKYNPGTKALTGAILEQICSFDDVGTLYNSIKPVTEFRFNLSEGILKNKRKWRII
ncbi:MAG: DUF6088 family protein [Bacteroidales bacterium]|nr:DUF6088 family protein [Bacteroidales bacterium]